MTRYFIVAFLFLQTLQASETALVAAILAIDWDADFENPLFNEQSRREPRILKLQEAEIAQDVVKPVGAIRPGELRSPRSRSGSTSSFSSPDGSQRTLRMSVPGDKAIIVPAYPKIGDDTGSESVSDTEGESSSTHHSDSPEESRTSATSEEKRFSATSDMVDTALSDGTEDYEVGAGALMEESGSLDFRGVEMGTQTEAEWSDRSVQTENPAQLPSLQRHGSGQKSRRIGVFDTKSDFRAVAQEHASELKSSQDIQDELEELKIAKETLDAEIAQREHEQKVLRIQLMHVLLEKEYWKQQLSVDDLEQDTELSKKAEALEVNVTQYVQIQIKVLLEEQEEIKKEQKDLQFQNGIAQQRLEEIKYRIEFLGTQLKQLITQDKKVKHSTYASQDSFGSWLWSKMFGAPEVSAAEKARRDSTLAKKASWHALEKLKESMERP